MAAPSWGGRRLHRAARVSGRSTEHLWAAIKGQSYRLRSPTSTAPLGRFTPSYTRLRIPCSVSTAAVETEVWVLYDTVSNGVSNTKPSLPGFQAWRSPQLNTWPPYLWSPLNPGLPTPTTPRQPGPWAEAPEETYRPTCDSYTHTHTHLHFRLSAHGCTLTFTLQKVKSNSPKT